MLFIKIGYHPIAGLTMAYASAVGGFAANIVVGMQDALVYSFTEPATRIVSDSIKTNVAIKLVLYRSECRCITSYDIASYN